MPSGHTIIGSPLSRRSHITANALRDLRDKGQAVWRNLAPYQTTVMRRLISSRWVDVTTSTNGTRVMVVNDAGRAALAAYESRYLRTTGATP